MHHSLQCSRMVPHVTDLFFLNINFNSCLAHRTDLDGEGKGKEYKRSKKFTAEIKRKKILIKRHGINGAWLML